MTRGPYEPTPAAVAYNQAQRVVMDLISDLTVSELHAYRARVRVASSCPPPIVATTEQVQQAVNDTAPTAEAAEMVAVDTMLHRPKSTVAR